MRTASLKRSGSVVTVVRLVFHLPLALLRVLMVKISFR